MKLRHLTALAIACLLSDPSAAETVIANSALQFSGTQGRDGWFYGTWNADLDGYQPNEFVPFGPDAWFPLPAPELGIWWTPPFNAEPWTLIGANRQHSETEPYVWTVRRWVSTMSGPARLSGKIAKNFNGVGGDGARGVIMIDGVTVYDQAVAPDDTVGFDYSIDVTLAAGSYVDMLLDPLLTDALDTTLFSCEVTDLTPPGPSYGEGCPGSGGFLPRVEVTGTPQPGKTVVLRIDRGLGGASAVTYMGYAKANFPIGSGCSLLVQPLLPFVIGPFSLNGSGAGNGKLNIGLGIPSSFPPITFTFQTFIADAGGAAGFSNSNGWEMVIAP